MKKGINFLLLLFSFIGVEELHASLNTPIIDSLTRAELSKNDIHFMDSAINIYTKNKNDSNGVYALIDVGKTLMKNGKYLKAIHVFEEALQLSKEIKFPKGEGNSLYYIGYTYNNSGNNNVALNYYFESIKVSRKIKDYNALATNLNNIGMVYSSLGEIKNAIKYYEKSLFVFKKINNDKDYASAITNLSNLHIRLGEIDVAMKYNNEALAIYQKSDNVEGLSAAYNTIGFIHYQTGDEQKAFEYLEKGYELGKKTERKDLMGQSLVFKGYIYGLNREYNKAQSNFLEALKMFEEVNHYDGISNTLSQISNNYRKQKDYANALKYAIKGMKASKASSDVYAISESAWLLSNIHEKKENYREALKLYKYHIEMRDSILNEDNQQEIIKQQMNYEHEKKEAKLTADYNQQMAVEKKEKQQQRIITAFTVVGLLIVMILLVFIYKRLQVTKKQKQVIEEQKEVVEAAHNELEEKNQEITDSIQYAKRIQNAILPPAKVVKEYLKKSFIFYKPKDIVAGDFYWMEHKDGKVLFAAADCTGHGVPGAMVSVVCNNALNRSVREHGLMDPGEILNKTREIVIQEFEKSDEDVKDGMDIALCSLEGNKLQYAGAHNPLWIVRSTRHSELVSESPEKSDTTKSDEIAGRARNDDYIIYETKANKQPIGQFDYPEPYITHSFELQAGDTIYIFSDGYVDQFGGDKGKKFKAKAFRELLLSVQDKAMDEQKTIINNIFETWKGDLEQIDDVCIIGVRI